MSSSRPAQVASQPLPTTFAIDPFRSFLRAISPCRMLLWNLRLYFYRSSWFEIIAALFYDLNLKRFVALHCQDDDLNAWSPNGAEEGEAT